jgi:hypothetical protein
MQDAADRANPQPKMLAPHMRKNILFFIYRLRTTWCCQGFQSVNMARCRLLKNSLAKLVPLRRFC